MDWVGHAIARVLGRAPLALFFAAVFILPLLDIATQFRVVMAFFYWVTALAAALIVCALWSVKGKYGSSEKEDSARRGADDHPDGGDEDS